jgi:hypothetical protein
MLVPGQDFLPPAGRYRRSVRWNSRFLNHDRSGSGSVLPRPVLATVGGVTHRLYWADRYAGFRMRCSCGWLPEAPCRRETRAIDIANAHVIGVQKAAKNVAYAKARAARSEDRAERQRARQRRSE